MAPVSPQAVSGLLGLSLESDSSLAKTPRRVGVFGEDDELLLLTLCSPRGAAARTAGWRNDTLRPRAVHRCVGVPGARLRRRTDAPLPVSNDQGALLLQAPVWICPCPCIFKAPKVKNFRALQSILPVLNRVLRHHHHPGFALSLSSATGRMEKNWGEELIKYVEMGSPAGTDEIRVFGFGQHKRQLKSNRG